MSDNKITVLAPPGKIEIEWDIQSGKEWLNEINNNGLDDDY